MPTRASESRSAVGSKQDQTVMLARTRCNVRDLEERLQDRDRELRHLREEFKLLQLDYQHALARIWSMNAAAGR